MFKPKSVHVVCFDLFGTLFDLSQTPREERIAYGEHIKKPWAPLSLPDSWENLPLFPDVDMSELRRYVEVATMSNCPIELQMKLAEKNGLEFDYYVDLSKAKVFKPNRRAYIYAARFLNTSPKNLLMVSANKNFGDLEWSKLAGWRSQLLRGNELEKNMDFKQLILEFKFMDYL